MIKSYIFDLFGTLAQYTGKEKLRKFLSQEEHEHLLVTKLNDSKLPEERRKIVEKLLNESKLYLYEESEQIIKKLKKDYKLGIISNAYEIIAKRAKKEFSSFLENFEIIAFSSELGIMKPDYKIFSYVINKLGIKPEEAMMVGDKIERDIAPAQQLGMSTILIGKNGQTLKEILKW